MGKFTVSVIVPNYNNDKYLRKCLDSILSQTYSVKELVVYDDCSTDGSKEILKEYSDKYPNVMVIYGQKNLGVSAARDLAIRSTTADYVCMVDSDDYFYCENKIAAEMAVIDRIYRESGKRIISFSQTVDVNEFGAPFATVRHVDLNGKERFRIITRLYKNLMPRDYCFPRDTYFECGGYTLGLSLYEDWELNIKFLQKTEFVYSGAYGTAYRHKKGGLSSAPYEKHLTTKISIFKKFQTSLPEKIMFYLLAYTAYIMHKVIG